MFARIPYEHATQAESLNHPVAVWYRSACSRSSLATPPPTVPQPINPTPISFFATDDTPLKVQSVKHSKGTIAGQWSIPLPATMMRNAGRIRHKASRAARIVVDVYTNDRSAQRRAFDSTGLRRLSAIFEGAGLKFTAERARILDSVLSKLGVFEADELLHEMRQGGRRVSKATIYRTLKHLQDSKIITEILIDSKQAHYQLSIGRDPKGFLVCAETHE